MHHIAMFVGKHLKFNVSWFLQKKKQKKNKKKIKIKISIL